MFFKKTFHLTFDFNKVIFTEAFSHAAWSSLWAFYQISSGTHWPLKSVDIQGNPCMLTKVKGGWILGCNDVSEEKDKVRQKYFIIRTESTLMMKYTVNQVHVNMWKEGGRRGLHGKRHTVGLCLSFTI